MTPLLTLQLAMVATAALVAPFHRFAAVYVSCYAGAVGLRFLGLPEEVVNPIWHSAVLIAGASFPMIRSESCLFAMALFCPMLVIDAMRLQGLMDTYSAWWAVWWMVMAQLAALPYGIDWKRARATLRAWRDSASNNFLRESIA